MPAPAFSSEPAAPELPLFAGTAALEAQTPMITELEFKSLSAQGYNRIPLMAEAFADLETPLSLYLKLALSRDGGKHSFLLESVVGGERFGRYSFIGLPARTLRQLASAPSCSMRLFAVISKQRPPRTTLDRHARLAPQSHAARAAG